MFEKMTDRDREVFRQMVQEAVRPLLLEMARVVRGAPEPAIKALSCAGVTETDIERDGHI